MIKLYLSARDASRSYIVFPIPGSSENARSKIQDSDHVTHILKSKAEDSFRRCPLKITMKILDRRHKWIAFRVHVGRPRQFRFKWHLYLLFFCNDGHSLGAHLCVVR